MRTAFIDSVRQDALYALRSCRRTPAFTLVALFVLALGIAANTTIFSVVNAALLRPLPVSKPEDLRFLGVVFVRESNFRHGVPYRTFEQLDQRRDVFSGVAGFFGDGAKIGNGVGATRVIGERVTTGYFDVLGVHAAFGRTFVASDDLPGADQVIVVSDRFWRTKLDANPNVLGTTINLRTQYTNGGTYLRHHRVYTIVGVMPPAFKGITTVWVPSDYWVPLRQRATDLVGAQTEISGGNSDAAAAAAVRVSERRARLLGLDEPVVTKNELSGALSVSAEKYAAEKELFLRLPIEQLEALAREHQALLDRAFSMARAHGVMLDTAPCAPVERGDGRDSSGPQYIGADVARAGGGDRVLDQDCVEASSLPISGSPSPAAGAADVGTGELAEPSTPPAVTDQ